MPSRLKRLDLPPSEFGCLCIPDCVEVVFGGIGKRDGQHRLLQFSRESSLIEIELRHRADLWRNDSNRESDAFLDLSKEIMRRFRCKFEGL
jgi:hypothetical protein